MTQTHVAVVLDAIEAKLANGEQVPAAYLLVGPAGCGQDEAAVRLSALGLDATMAPSVDHSLDNPFTERPLVLRFYPEPITEVPAHVPAFLHAVATQRFADALDVAEAASARAGSVEALLDGCIDELAKRLRAEPVGSTAAVAAIRELWEVRWRLVNSPVPLRPALAVLLAQLQPAIANVIERPAAQAAQSPQPSVAELGSLLGSG